MNIKLNFLNKSEPSTSELIEHNLLLDKETAGAANGDRSEGRCRQTGERAGNGQGEGF